MANPEHVRKLCEGPAAWNAWREANPTVVPDLAFASLSLSQRQFGPSNGGPVNLHGVNLEGTMLRFATLTASSLEGARLVGADLMHARLDRASLINADLTDAILEHTDLTGTRLDGATLVGASLQNARNLRQTQVDAAHGDASTLLPLGLVAPPRWFPAASPEEFLGCPIPEEIREDELDSDPHRLLGVAPKAEPAEIREAYRKLVKQLHPDLNPGNREAAVKFRKINEAYSLLKNGPAAAERSAAPAGPSAWRGRYEAAAAVALFLAIGGGVFYWLETVPHAPQVVSAGRDATPAEKPISEAAPSPVERNTSFVTEQPNAEALKPETPKVEAAPETPTANAEPPVVREAAAPEAAPQPQPQAPLLARAEQSERGSQVDTRPEAESEPQPRAVETQPKAESGEPSPLVVAQAPLAAHDTSSAHPRSEKPLPSTSKAGSELLSARGEPTANSAPVRVAVWEEEWQRLRDSHDLATLYGFIRRHPGEPAAAGARERYHLVLASLSSPAELAGFVKKHGGQDNPEMNAARQRLASLVDGEAQEAELKAWETAEKKNTRAAYDGYLRVYKDGPHAAQANEKIVALREAYRQRDAAAWAKAELENNRNAYSAYLAAHPRGYHVKEAQRRLGNNAQGQERLKPKPTLAPSTTDPAPNH